MNRTPMLRQNVVFAILFLMGANLLIGSSYRAEQDTWISILMATGIMIILSLVLARISVLHPGKDVFALLKLLPKWISFPLIGLTAYYCFEQAAITLRVYTGFVHIVSLPNTNIIILPILTGIIIWFLINREDRVLFQFSYMTAIPIFLIILLLIVFLFPMFRSENLLPFCYNNGENILLCSAENFAFPFGNIFLLLGLTFFPKESKKERNVWVIVAVISGILSLLVVFQNILLLGGKLSDFLDFPYNYAASLVNVGDFFSRIEVFASLFFFLSAILRTSYLIRLTLRGIESLCNVEPKSISFPMIALLCFYTAVAFDNTNSVFNYLKIFPIFAIPFQVGVPLLLWFYCEKTKSKTAAISCPLNKQSVRLF